MTHHETKNHQNKHKSFIFPETELRTHLAINTSLNMKLVKNILLCLLQLSVQPAVLLFLDKQRDDVAVVEAKQCVVVARRVGKDGSNSGLPAHIETGRLGCRL